MSEPINILMVDDQPAKLLTYESMLSGMGERLIKAETASEALAHLLKEDIAVVLMDVNMPELDGFELAAMIRQHPRCRRTAILFVSAVHLTDVDRVRGYAAGAVDYVSVPVVPEILRAKIGVFVDLYRKTSELERLNHTLEERVLARTGELEATIAQLREREHRLRLSSEALEEADRRKTEFLAMLAHELRNPLQPIRSAVELLRRSSASPDQLVWSREVVDRQVNQLVRLVDDLLDASRISNGKLELRREPVDLVPIIDGAIESSRSLADRRQQAIEASLPQGTVQVDGDAVRLTQVFHNLISNAVKYSPTGAKITLSVQARDGEVVTHVRDQGMGIAAHDLPRVFEMFYQGSAKPDDAQGGLGLGLALVHQLVGLHGGRIEAYSEGPGKGSEFVVRLPTIDTKRASPMQDTIAAVDAPARPRRILVVDDNRDAAETLAMMLRLEGNEVSTAFDGESAIAVTAEFNPEVVLMDLGMPKVDGYQAARAIRRDRSAKEVVLIALTGWGGDVDRKLSQEAGFDRHLVKPVVPTELLEILSSLPHNGAAH